MKRSGPIKRKTPMRRVSKKRQKENKEYSVLRKGFLKKLPICEVCMTAAATDVHHMDKRGKNLNEVGTWLAVCRPCHDKIHSNPSWAREKGYLV